MSFVDFVMEIESEGRRGERESDEEIAGGVRVWKRWERGREGGDRGREGKVCMADARRRNRKEGERMERRTSLWLMVS